MKDGIVFSVMLSHFVLNATSISLICLLLTLLEGLELAVSIVIINLNIRVDIFIEAINCQLMELDHRFNDSLMELLHLSTTLDPKTIESFFKVVMYVN